MEDVIKGRVHGASATEDHLASLQKNLEEKALVVNGMELAGKEEHLVEVWLKYYQERLPLLFFLTMLSSTYALANARVHHVAMVSSDLLVVR